MGILRTDVVSHSQLEATGGSLELDGVGDYLTFGAHNSFSPATSDVTFELWFYLTADVDFRASSGNYYFFDMGSNGYRIQMYEGLIRFGIDGSNWTPPATGVSKTKWHHVAGVREGNSLDLYLDGKHVGQKTMTSSVTSTSLTIGNYGGAPYDGEPYGYISNFRYVRGVVYRNNFTPPKFELKNIPGTIVLGCQSSSSATDFAVTPSTITAQGNATSSAFHPGLKKDITDTGVVFDGVTTFDSQAFMVPPSGKTSERNRGRGISFGGDNNTTSILFVDIQSQGNGQDFGDLTAATVASPGACASSTRGLYGGGTPSNTDTIGFITIANTANALDFGNLTQARRQLAACSNDTRGLFGSGRVSDPVNTIDFITIATTGDASDFGDVTTAARYLGSTSSTTRGFWFGGNAPTATNVINFVTIATTGDASDFGDLTEAKPYPTGCSSSTRAITFGGMVSSPNYVNTIEFFTMASAGNATDFGDCIEPNGNSSGMSNGIRGVRFAGAVVSGSYTNSIDFINIATTGNASDFGDFITAGGDGAGTSDSHGGLS